MAQTKASIPMESYQRIIELGYDAISIFDRKGTCIYTTPSVETLLGYTVQERIGNPGMAIVHPDDLSPAQELFSQVMKNPGKTIKGDLRLMHKNGKTIIVNHRVTNLLDDPAVKGIVTNYHDVTDHRTVEEQYKTLVEQGNDGILIIQDELLKYANDKLLKTLGYTPEELIGTLALQYIAPEYQKIAVERYTKRIKGMDTPSIYEAALIAKNGRKLPVEVSTAVIRYAGEPAIMGVFRDITERKKAEKKVREAATTASVILNATADMNVLANLEGSVIDCNDAFSKSLGVKKEDVVGSTLEKWLPAEVFETRMGWLQKVAKTKKAVHWEDSRGGRWFENRLYPVINEVGKVHQIVALLRDITEEKQMREKSMEKEKLVALGQISSVIAHELNTPLATINLTTQILSAAVSDELQGDIETIQSEVKRASTLVVDILGFTNMRQLSFSDVNIKELVENALHRQQQLYNVDQITFDVALNDDVIRGDADKLSMAFENIIKNAILAQKSPNETHTISIHERVADGTVVVTVQDTGVGIDEKDIQKNFKPFFTTRERGAGSGLGLYIAEWLIQNHNGQIHAESTKGEGSTFTITLPLLTEKNSTVS